MNKLRKILLLLGLPIIALAQTNTVTTTTLSSAIAQPAGSTPPSQFVALASATGVNVPSITNGTQGTMLFIDREAMKVVAQIGTTTTFQVVRGQNGTRAAGHLSGATVWVGNPQWFKTTDPIGTCSLGTEFASPWINTATGSVFVCNGNGVYGLASGWFFVPPGSCAVTAGTDTIATAQALVRAASGNIVLQTTTGAGGGTINVDCPLSPTESQLFGFPGAVTLTGASLLYGTQTTAWASIAAPIIDSVTYPTSTAGGAAAAGTVATTAAGTLTITPTSLQLITTTTGLCFNENITFGTPYPVSTNNQQLVLEQVFTASAATTILQICGVEVYYTTNPPSLSFPK